MERLDPTVAPLLIDRVRKNGCALLNFDFVYSDLVRWLEREYTNINIDYTTILDNLRTLQMLHGYPKVDLGQTRETLMDGAPMKCTFTSSYEHARQLAQYDNRKGIHEHIDIMTKKFAKKEEKSYHLCFPHSFLYFIPGIVVLWA
jgi:hypothetical protein